MNKIAALMLSLIALPMVSPEPAWAQTSHEANCTVTNINWSSGQVNLACASGSVYVAFLTGNTSAGACQTTDIDTLKVFESLGISARVSQLVVTVWYTPCGIGTGAITSLELTGN
jgi:hypothetical protein